MTLTDASVKKILAQSQQRLVLRVDVPGLSAKILTAYWPEIQQTDLDACMNFLRANPTWMGLNPDGTDSTTDPRIQDQPFEGSFWGVPRLEYGPADLTVPGRPQVLNLYRDYLPASITGPSAVVEDSCRFLVTAYTVYYSTTPPSVAGLHTPGIKWVVTDPVLDQKTGLYQATIKKIERLEQEYEFESEDNAQFTETTHVKLGTTDAIQSLTPQDGQRIDQSVEKNDDCTNDERVRTQDARDQVGGGSEERADRTTTVETHTQTTFLSVPAAQNGQIVSGNSTPTAFKNRFATNLETQTAVNQTVTVEEVRADRTSSATTNTQASAAITTPPVPNDGETRTATNRPTSFKNRWETTLETQTALDQTISEAEVRADQVIARTTHTQNASTVTVPPVPADGEQRSATNEPTAFKNRTRTTEETRTAVDVQGGGSEERADRTTTVETHTQTTFLSVPAAQNGQIVSGNSTPTAFKNRFATNLETQTAVNQTVTVEEVRADRTSSATTNTQASAAITTPPVPNDGETRTATNRPTAFKNRWETTLETQTALDQTISEAEVRADQVIARTTHTQNASTVTVPPVPADGEQRSATNEPTAFKNRTRTTEETRTAVDVQGGGSEERADRTTTVETHTNTTLLAVPAAADGQIVSGNSTPTAFKNRFATNLETQTAVDQTISEAEVRADRSIARTTHTQNSGTVTVPPVPSAGESRSARNEPTAFKNRTRTTEETATATKIETGDMTWTDANGDGTVYEGVNLTAAEVLAKLAAINPARNAVPSIRASREFNGRFDLDIRQRDVDENTGGYGDAFTTGTADWTYTNQRTNIDYHVYVKFTTSLNSAQTFLNTSAGGTIVGSDSGNRTGLTYVGRGRIAATRVEMV